MTSNAWQFKFEDSHIRVEQTNSHAPLCEQLVLVEEADELDVAQHAAPGSQLLVCCLARSLALLQAFTWKEEV